MWNFNKVGRVITETYLQRGLIARLTKVWPWRRKSLSCGHKYLVTVTNPQGIEIYNHYHTHKVLFDYVVLKYQEEVRPLKSWHDDVDVHAFSLDVAVESYIGLYLPDGTYLVMVPLNKKVAEAFWKVKADEVSMNHEDLRLDCYVANISEFEGDLSMLVENSYLKYPGRYIRIVVKDGFTQTSETLK